MTNEAVWRFASEHAPNGLYKYRRFNTKKDRDRVKRILLNGEIYFSSRLELNDPFELRIALQLNPNKRKVIAGLAQGAQRVGKLRGATAKQVMVWQAKLRMQSPAALLQFVQIEHNKRLESDCFIYCLSAEHDNPILWAHYADSHAGLCIAFNSRVHPFLGACGVDYPTEYPTSPFPRLSGEEDKLYQKSVFNKSLHWRYESEYRLCSLRMDNPSWDLGLKWPAKQIALIQPRAINRIYIGARMLPPRRKELINFCRRHRPDIKIFLASPSDSSYKLEFTEV